MSPADHLIAMPIVVPLAAGALMLLVEERRHALKAAMSLAAALAVLATAIALVQRAEAPLAHVYALGNWPAPFGIVLVADRLAAAMVLLASTVVLCALVFSLARWARAAAHWHSLVHFLFAGVNGAFLTGDLFNLFVFFELMLAASYGLALHASGTARVRASLHYVVLNLAASLLFLIGVSLLYGATGTLNMADLALRIPAVAPEDRQLVEIGAAVLGIAFLVKAAMWPLCFWLPATYAPAAAPAAALLSLLSKVGVYALLRTSLVAFDGAGGGLLFYGGLATLTFGLIGVLASQDLARLASYSVLISSGTLLAAIGYGGAAATGAALYYLVGSVLGIAAFYLLIELVERAREPGADVLAVTAEAFDLEGEQAAPEQEVGVTIPATMALLGFAFACAALLIAGLPPLPGFLAKFALLAAALDAEPVPAAAWALLALLTLSGLAAVIGLGRAGVRVFWASQPLSVPRVRVIELVPVALLLALCLALSVAAGPAMRYAADAAQALHLPRLYIDEVLSRP
jgi:multicomponent K+:H+ antiporter subunit D